MLNYKIHLYYAIKRFIPRRMQLAIRRNIVLRKLGTSSDVWPINERAAKPPDAWSGWPEGKRFALVLTHDVETQKGHDRALQLADLEERFGFRSSFNFVADDYVVSPKLREELTERGFEVGIHGLTHNARLYSSREEFKRQAKRINLILKEWKAVGFRSPCMFHNLEWIHDLNIEYDSSTFDTDPFEPQPDGLDTIFPLRIPGDSDGKGYVELPYTLPQDFTVFILLKHNSNEIFKRKLDWIVQHGGLALTNTHPDYTSFGEKKLGSDEYPVGLYKEFLEHVRNTFKGTYWHVLPREMAGFWAAREDAHRESI